MIKHITYDGKQYPIRISYYVLEMVASELNLKMDDITTNITAQKDVLWYALIAGHHMAKKELTLKREDCVWILDECYLEYQRALFEFGKSIVDMQEDLMKGEDKKK